MFTENICCRIGVRQVPVRKRGAELMSDAGEQASTHVHHFFLDLQLLVQQESLAVVLIEGVGDDADEEQIEHPSPPRVPPGLTDGDGEQGLVVALRCLQVEDILAWWQVVEADAVLSRRLSLGMVGSL